MGKSRDLFKKIGDIKGTFHCKGGHNEGQIWYGPNRSRRGVKNTQKNCTKKVLITWIAMMVWSLTQSQTSQSVNKARGGDGIPVELFQILKDDTVKVLHSICQQIWKTQQWPQDWKSSVFVPMPKKGNAKDCSNYCTIAPISLHWQVDSLPVSHHRSPYCWAKASNTKPTL